MTALPAAGYFTSPSRTNAQAKQGQDDMLAALREQPGSDAESTLTIAAGAVTPTRGLHAIETEGATSADDLTNIGTANHPDGRLLLIRCADAGHAVTAKHNAGGAGQIALADGADLVLNNRTLWLVLKRTGTDWEEIGRFFGSASAAARTFLKTPFNGFLTKTGAYTLAAGDAGKVILADATAAAFTIGALAAATAGAGYWIGIKKTDLSANAVTFDPNAAETADGAATVALAVPNEIQFFESDGANWRIVGAYKPNAASLSEAQAWTKPQRPQAKHTATLSGSQAPDMAAYCDFDWTLNGNLTINNPTLTAAMVGQRGRIRLIQDGTGGRTLSSLGSYFKRAGGTGAPSLPSAANAVQRWDYEIVSTARIEYSAADVEA